MTDGNSGIDTKCSHVKRWHVGTPYQSMEGGAPIIIAFAWSSRQCKGGEQLRPDETQPRSAQQEIRRINGYLMVPLIGEFALQIGLAVHHGRRPCWLLFEIPRDVCRMGAVTL